MRTLAYTLMAASILSVPLASFAQATNQPLTRAEVKQQLIEVEQAGYNPAASDDATYPAEIQAAERRVAMEQQAAQPGTGSYGPATNGSAQAGGQTMSPAASPANVGN
jgi:hypothetical protein